MSHPCGWLASAGDYQDGEDVECEIVQMIGDIEEAMDIGPADVML